MSKLTPFPAISQATTDTSDAEDQDFKVYKPKSRRDKKLLFIILLTLLPILIIIALLSHYMQPNQPLPINATAQNTTQAGSNPKTREDYAFIAKDVYNRTYDSIASLDLHTGNRKLLQIHFPSGPGEIKRRDLVRKYQINPFKDKYGIDFKFILGEPEASIVEGLKAENATYGDLLVIPNYIDSRLAGRTTKSPEYYQYLINYTAPGSEYKFVGRIDMDCYVNFDRLFSKYYTPEIRAQDNDFTIVTAWVGDFSNWDYNKPYDWPQGAFYIISWKMMLMFRKIYENAQREVWADDELLGIYLYDTQLKFINVKLSGSEAYELFNLGDWESRYSKTDSVRIHELKDETKYIKVASDILNIIGYQFPQ